MSRKRRDEMEEVHEVMEKRKGKLDFLTLRIKCVHIYLVVVT